MNRLPKCLLLLAALVGTGAPAAARGQDALQIQFIANMAVRLSDGGTTLVSDFPYRSGHAGYMTWSLDGIEPLDDAVAVITHEHADHWDRELWDRMGLRLIAPPEITAGLERSRVMPWAETIRIGAVTVRPLRTSHTDAHHSYRVSWRGLELYFTGDTEDTTALMAQSGLDVAFVSPWLLEVVDRAGERIDADLIVVYHHRDPTRELPAVGELWVPRRGEARRVAFPR